MKLPPIGLNPKHLLRNERMYMSDYVKCHNHAYNTYPHPVKVISFPLTNNSTRTYSNNYNLFASLCISFDTSPAKAN